MSPVLLWLSGVVVGAAAAWAVTRLGAARRRGVAEIAVPAPKLPGIDLPIEPTLDTLLRLLVDQAASRVELPCAAALREQDGGPLRIRTASAAADPRFVGIDVDVQSLAGRVVTEGMPIVEPVARAMLTGPAGDRRQRPSGGVGVPLAAGPRVFGVLMAFGEPALSGTEAVALLDPLARAFAPYILPAMEADIAKRRAETDALTDLPNRRGFDKALRRIGAGPAALVAIDIDHFKQVNDTLGHAAGDAALRHLGRLLRDALREGDVAARVGGEEFSVLLPGGDLRLGMDVAERIRALVESRPFLAGGGERRLTVSCGVSAMPYPIAHSDNLAAAADAALYRAKGAGRNCVVVSGPPGGAAGAGAPPAGPASATGSPPGPPARP